MQLADGKTEHAAHLDPKWPSALKVAQPHFSPTPMAGWHTSDELSHIHNLLEQTQQPCMATVPHIHFSVQCANIDLASLGVPQLDALVIAGAEEAAPIIAAVDVLDPLQPEH